MKKIKEKIKNEPIIFMFQKMWSFSNNKKRIIFYSLLYIFANIIALFSPIIFGKFMNEIQKNNINSENISYLIILLLGSILINMIYWFIYGPARIIENANAFDLRRNYQKFLLKNILAKRLQWHTDRDSGDTIDKINNSSQAIFSFSSSSYVAIENFVRVVGTIIAISFFNFYIALSVLVFMFFPFFVMNKFDKNLVKKYEKLNKYKNNISAKIFDYFTNISSIVILNIRKVVLVNILKKIEKPKKDFLKMSKINEMKWFTISQMMEIFITIPLIIYVFYSYKNNIFIKVGTITTLYLYLRNISGVFSTVGWYYQGVIEQKVSMENIKEIEDSFNKQGIELKKEKKVEWKSLEIKKLSFKYDLVEKDILHLNNIHLKIKKGEKIAFIGKSGSGKTTFLKVLHGLYENAQSEISFDKENFQKTNFADLDLKTMLVPQEPELFSSSIRENVTFGLDYTDKEVKKVLELSGFLEVLEKLPKGLNSVVNEKGVNLSGGQKQRLALARALLFSGEKEIILLDESTSSVDPNSEVKIYKNIFKEFSGKTFLASIHKMNLLKYFDRIIIFENGKIADSGTFEKLYKQNEDFKKQWDEYVKEK